jgi:hypothetical protein
MPKHDPMRQALEQLGSLRSVPDDVLHAQLCPVLRGRSSLVIAKAAKLSAERRFAAAVPDLWPLPQTHD